MPDIIPTFSTMTRIFEDCNKCLTTLRHLHQWQEYLETVSSAWHHSNIFNNDKKYLETVLSAWIHSNIFNNDKNIWRLFQVPDIIPTFSTMTRIFEDCIKCLTTLRYLPQWQEYLEIVSSAWHHSNIFNTDKNILRLYQMSYYTQTFTPMTRIFGDCYKCLTSFQHFQNWQEYLKIVSNALLHSDIYPNDKNIWRLFKVPDIIPTFSTMTRIFEDGIKCLTTLRHLPQWKEYLEIVSSAWHHSNIFNNDKNIWRLFQVPDIIPTFSTMTRVFEVCKNALLHSDIYTNDKNIWRLFRVPDIIPPFSTMTRIFEDCFECLISFQHFQQWQEYLKIVSNALLHSDIYTNDKNIWRLFRVPDIIPTF